MRAAKRGVPRSANVRRGAVNSGRRAFDGRSDGGVRVRSPGRASSRALLWRAIALRLKLVVSNG